MARLLETARAAQQAYWCCHVGEPAQVLWERQRAGSWLGLTDNYIRVQAAARGPRPRRLQAARLVAAAAEGMIAIPEAGAIRAAAGSV